MSKFEITSLQIQECLVETDTLEEAGKRVAGRVNREIDRWLDDVGKYCLNKGIVTERHRQLRLKCRKQWGELNSAVKENLRLVNIIKELEKDINIKIQLIDDVLYEKTIYKCADHGVTSLVCCKPHSTNQGKFKWRDK